MAKKRNKNKDVSQRNSTPAEESSVTDAAQFSSSMEQIMESDTAEQEAESCGQVEPAQERETVEAEKITSDIINGNGEERVNKEPTLSEIPKPNIPLLNIDAMNDNDNLMTGTENGSESNTRSNLAEPKQQRATRRPISAASSPLKRNKGYVNSKITPPKPSEQKSVRPVSGRRGTEEMHVRETKSSARREQLSNRSKISAMEDSYSTQRIIHLENELNNAIKTIDTITSEKSVLERVVKIKDAALVKSTLDYDDSTREVESLKNDLKMKDLKIDELNKLNDTLSEVDALKKMTEERQPGDNSLRRSQIKALPEETLDRIMLLENTLKIRDQKIKSLEAEIHTMNLLAKKRDKYTDQLNTEIADLKFKQDKTFELESRNSELSVTIQKLTKEIRTQTIVQKTKNEAIEKLSMQIESLKAVKEDNNVLLNQALVKDKKIKDLEQEIGMASKALEAKEEEIVKMINESDAIIPVRSLENDKRFLMSKVKKLQDKLDENGRTIFWQNRQIEKLTKRMTNITIALRETEIDKLLRQRKIQQRENNAVEGSMSEGGEATEDSSNTGGESVDISLFNVLQANVEELRRHLHEKEAVTSDKDLLIETLEKKIVVLERSRDCDTRKFRAKLQHLEGELGMHKESLRSNEIAFKQRETDLKRSMHAMKKKLHGKVPSQVMS